MVKFYAGFLLGLFSAITSLGEEDAFLQLSNTPLGTRENPRVMRTYFPDPGLGRAVMANHDLGARARKYSPGKGDVEGFVDPIPGIPGAIGVNFGTDLSFCWDTTECRLLYAWRGGFLDMKNYWGEPESGRRKGFAYLPELIGELIYLTKGTHPLAIFDNYTEGLTPVFEGYRLVEGAPEFTYTLGETRIAVRIEPGAEPMTFVKHYTIENAEDWGYHESGYSFEEVKGEGKQFQIVVKGKPVAASGASAEKVEYSTAKPNEKWGEALYTNLGCFACHTTDGARGHGPTFAGLYGVERPITDQSPVVADDDYISESITDPMAKVVESYPAGYMPPYPLGDDEIAAITLFIKTLANE